MTQRLFLIAHSTSDADRRRKVLAGVVLLHREVAESVALRYRRRGLPAEDLCQAAYEGLVKAVHRFDPDLGYDFMSYAVPTMRGEVQRYFRDQGWVVRPPRRLQDLQRRFQQVTESPRVDLRREPDRTEILCELGVGARELDEAMQAYGSFTPISLDLPEGAEESGQCIADQLPAVDTGFDAAEARLAIEPLLDGRSPRDRRILHLRHCEGLTQAEVGVEIGVTQMQVSRLLTRILGHLRSHLSTAA